MKGILETKKLDGEAGGTRTHDPRLKSTLGSHRLRMRAAPKEQLCKSLVFNRGDSGVHAVDVDPEVDAAGREARATRRTARCSFPPCPGRQTGSVALSGVEADSLTCSCDITSLRLATHLSRTQFGQASGRPCPPRTGVQACVAFGTQAHNRTRRVFARGGSGKPAVLRDRRF